MYVRNQSVEPWLSLPHHPTHLGDVPTGLQESLVDVRRDLLIYSQRELKLIIMA